LYIKGIADLFLSHFFSFLSSPSSKTWFTLEGNDSWIWYW